MSGHSKWATIRRKKGAIDAKRGKIFTKIIREIATAARMGGGDPAGNPRLRLIVDKARAANMPKDNIERAIQKGVGGGEGEQFEEVVYEGYGPGGTAILIRALTDNRNRTVGEIRHVLSRQGGNLGASGCVAYLFEKRGVLTFDRAGIDGDALMEAALDAGASDVEETDETLDVVTAANELDAVRAKLEAAGFRAANAEATMSASTTVKLEGDDAQKMVALSDALEDLDDVQSVYANFDISDEEMARLA